MDQIDLFQERDRLAREARSHEQEQDLIRRAKALRVLVLKWLHDVSLYRDDFRSSADDILGMLIEYVDTQIGYDDIEESDAAFFFLSLGARLHERATLESAGRATTSTHDTLLWALNDESPNTILSLHKVEDSDWDAVRDCAWAFLVLCGDVAEMVCECFVLAADEWNADDTKAPLDLQRDCRRRLAQNIIDGQRAASMQESLF